MADTEHSKCFARQGVRVRVPLPALFLCPLTCGNVVGGLFLILLVHNPSTLITGSRDWRADYVITHALHDAWSAAGKPLPEEVTLVTGKCPTGADYLAGVLAIKAGWTIEPHPADWEKYGRRAGFVRNAEMVDLGADLVLAFIRNDSKGATMTVKLAKKAGLPMVVWRVND